MVGFLADRQMIILVMNPSVNRLVKIDKWAFSKVALCVHELVQDYIFRFIDSYCRKVFERCGLHINHLLYVFSWTTFLQYQ